MKGTKTFMPKTDIHLHVEMKSQDTWVHSAFRGEFSDRIYGMFAVLGGIKNYFNLPTFELRGVPKDASSHTLTYYLVNVYDDEDFHEVGFNRKAADSLVEKGIFSYWDEKKSTVPNIDYHSASWCNSDELQKAFNIVFRNGLEEGYPVGGYWEWKALIAYMKSLEDEFSEVRAIFWFDK